MTSVDAYRQITADNAGSNAAAPVISGLTMPGGPSGPGNPQLSRLPDPGNVLR